MTHKEVVTSYFKALDNGDLATAKKLLGPHHRPYSSMRAEPANAEQHIAIHNGFVQGFGHGRHDWADLPEADNQVVGRGAWSALQPVPFKASLRQTKTFTSPL